MKQHNPAFLAMVTAAKSRVREVDVHAVKQMLDEQRTIALIDVREASEWVAGHLPTAIHLSKGIIECDIETIVPDHDKTLVLYCGGGFRSILAADNVQKMGYRQVVSMAGGFRAWQQAHFSIVKA